MHPAAGGSGSVRGVPELRMGWVSPEAGVGLGAGLPGLGAGLGASPAARRPGPPPLTASLSLSP